jgi:hypothetical protein
MAVVAAVLALALTGCEWGASSRRASSAGSAASAAALPSAARAQAGQADAMTLQRLESFAFNAFVVPVLDDSAVTRFADVRLAPLCGEDSDVRVDGQPIVPGEPVPAGAFELEWDMRLFCPFGPDGAALDGRTRVLVFRDDEHGMQAVVLPNRLTVSDEHGATTLTTQSPHWISDQWRTPTVARAQDQ